MIRSHFANFPAEQVVSGFLLAAISFSLSVSLSPCVCVRVRWPLLTYKRLSEYRGRAGLALTAFGTRIRLLREPFHPPPSPVIVVSRHRMVQQSQTGLKYLSLQGCLLTGGDGARRVNGRVTEHLTWQWHPRRSWMKGRRRRRQ